MPKSSAYRTALLVSFLAAAMGLTACETLPKSVNDITSRNIDTQDTLERSLNHRRHVGEHDGAEPSASQPFQATRVYTQSSVNQDVTLGSGVSVRPGRYSGLNGAVQTPSGTVELAFDNAPISDVVDQVIGKILGASFVIDPNVKGNVTLRTAGAMPKADIAPLMRQALSLSGVSLIETSGGSYTIIPSSQAGQFARAPQLASLRGDAQIVIAPLQYVSASEMERVLSSFTPQGARVQADSKRESLILSGSADQIDVMIETIEMFDVDWLAQMSFGVYEVLYASPDDLIAELSKVFGGEDGTIGTQVEFVSMPRLSSVMVISKRPERLAQAERWIRKLDLNVGGDERRVQFMPVENADAEAIADTLSDIFSDQGQGGSRAQFGSNANSASQNNSTSSGFTSGGQGPRIRADSASNALIVYATDEELRQIKSLMQNIDVLPDQVMIEAVIAEVSLNDDLRYGVQWFFDTRDGAQITSTDAAAGNVTARFPGFAYTFAGNYVQAALSALSAVTDIEVVSSPQIVTQDNQSATLQVGDQVPVVTQSAVSVDNPNAPIVNSIQYRDTGILLTVTPRINDGDVVVLEITQEVSNAVPTLTSGIDAPTIQQRQFDSVVNIVDGETLALGGLIRSSKTRGKSGIPIVKDIPVVGNLFSSQSDDRSRTELVIFLTPHIIRSREDARRATDHLRSKLTRLRLSGFSDAPRDGF